ncbi:MAG: ferredoxin [Chitinivibrionales bacterium]|nr:ferredoxin [Chitinivibrionales bacterium]
MADRNKPGSIEVNRQIRVSVDQSRCKTVGSCVKIAPEIFRFRSGDKKAEAIVETIPPALLQKCKEAADNCPYDAINISGESVE